jgi:hypothetical protein
MYKLIEHLIHLKFLEYHIQFSRIFYETDKNFIRLKLKLYLATKVVNKSGSEVIEKLQFSGIKGKLKIKGFVDVKSCNLQKRL